MRTFRAGAAAQRLRKLFPFLNILRHATNIVSSPLQDPSHVVVEGVSKKPLNSTDQAATQRPGRSGRDELWWALKVCVPAEREVRGEQRKFRERPCAAARGWSAAASSVIAGAPVGHYRYASAQHWLARYAMAVGSRKAARRSSGSTRRRGAQPFKTVEDPAAG